MTDARRKVHDHTDAMRDAASDLADRVDEVADEVSAASQRLGKHVRRVGEAVAEYSKDAERPATGVARALDDLGYEAKQSFDRITGRRPRPWYERLLFWR
jgi:phage-related minor tail protein